MSTEARVDLWGRQIGAVVWDEQRELGVFQYTPEFARSGIALSPIVMPPSKTPYSFPALRGMFHGLPGLVADSLPDKFGHRLIDSWLVSQGREPGSMDPVERLRYIGSRGIGALEYHSALNFSGGRDRLLRIDALARLADHILAERELLTDTLGNGEDTEAMQDILRVGTSAGGARAKALVAWNRATGEFRSGQGNLLPGYEHWLLKFDGISNNRDKELADPKGYGLVEYAYASMALATGIDMSPCHLLHEGGRSHFMTQRFDRTREGKKLHMQSLAALCHFDYNDPASYSYEQAIDAIRDVSSNVTADIEQQFLRTAFNVIARNQDDHVKNIAFLMNPAGEWRLSPAFDVIYAWNPLGQHTGKHQMRVNGKRDDFEVDDLIAFGRFASLKPRRARALLDQVMDAVRQWPAFAQEANVTPVRIKKIGEAHRLGLLPALAGRVAR